MRCQVRTRAVGRVVLLGAMRAAIPSSAVRNCGPRRDDETRGISHGLLINCGGGGRNRTCVHGFAGRCMTTLPPRHRRACDCFFGPLRLAHPAEVGWAASRAGLRTGPRPGWSCIEAERERRSYRFGVPRILERETRLELATPTLARLCSTTELFPRESEQRIIGARPAVSRQAQPAISPANPPFRARRASPS